MARTTKAQPAPATPSPVDIDSWSAWVLTASTTELEKFKKKLDDNAYYALEWSRAVVEEAADNEVKAVVRNVLFQEPEDKTTWTFEQALEDTLRMVRQEVRRHASSPEASSSLMSNALHREKLARYARMMEKLEALQERIKLSGYVLRSPTE